MKAFTEVVHHFFRGIARSRVSLIGAMMVTVIFPFLAGALIYDAIWTIKNVYVGGLIYMVLGPAFIGGLVLVFLGLFFFKGKEEVRLFTLEYLRGYFTDPSKFKKMRRLVFFAVFLTCVNLFIFGLLGYSSYGYMESVGFCGTFCHSVMTPEHTAYENSAHSRVPCVECHIGSGASWFVKAKIDGVKQLFAVALDTYPRPIPDPVTNLRPARDTCEHCHRPSKFHGDKLVVIDKYKPDEKNTHVQTVLMMKIGSGGDRVVSPKGIHWHVAPNVKIEYKTTTQDRMTIPEVIVYNKKTGTKKVFKTPDADAALKKAGSKVETRTMDCIDCHNRPTHIFLPKGQAIDKQILKGHIPQALPYIKKMAMQVVTPKYKSQDAAKKAIAAKLTAYYQKNYADLIQKKPELLTKAIAGVQTAFDQNVFPQMNIQWGTYHSNIGHEQDTGCWRCHDDNHSTKSGETISMDCNTCHNILAQDEKNPPILKQLDPENQ
jgi:hypothetical protein